MQEAKTWIKDVTEELDKMESSNKFAPAVVLICCNAVLTQKYSSARGRMTDVRALTMLKLLQISSSEEFTFLQKLINSQESRYVHECICKVYV